MMRQDSNIDGVWRGSAAALGNKMRTRKIGALAAEEVTSAWQRLEEEGHIECLGGFYPPGKQQWCSIYNVGDINGS